MTSLQPGPDAPRPRHPGPVKPHALSRAGGRDPRRGISAKTVLAYRHAWELKSVKIGKHIGFRERDLNAWMDNRPEA